jgi:uncharacterized protein Veg
MYSTSKGTYSIVQQKNRPRRENKKTSKLIRMYGTYSIVQQKNRPIKRENKKNSKLITIYGTNSIVQQKRSTRQNKGTSF